MQKLSLRSSGTLGKKSRGARANSNSAFLLLHVAFYISFFPLPGVHGGEKLEKSVVCVSFVEAAQGPKAKLQNDNSRWLRFLTGGWGVVEEGNRQADAF
jgi:hypothetical protein